MLKWLQNLDQKLEPTVEQFDRTVTEPVRKVLSFEVFADKPNAPVLFDRQPTASDPTPETVMNNEHTEAGIRRVPIQCCPANETL